MYEYISPSPLTLYSSDLCPCEHPVHSPTQICVCDTVSLQILGTVYHCVARETAVGHIDVKVTCCAVSCKEHRTSFCIHKLHVSICLMFKCIKRHVLLFMLFCTSTPALEQPHLRYAPLYRSVSSFSRRIPYYIVIICNTWRGFSISIWNINSNYMTCTFDVLRK